MALPSFYLGKMDRRKQRADEFGEGMDKGAAGIAASTDMLAKLQAKLQSDKLAEAKVSTETAFKERELTTKEAALKQQGDLAAKDDARADAAAKAKTDETVKTHQKERLAEMVRAAREEGLDLRGTLEHFQTNPETAGLDWRTVASEWSTQDDAGRLLDKRVAAKDVDEEMRQARLDSLRARADADRKLATEGKPMTPSDIQEVTAGRSSLDQLASLKKLASETPMGVFSWLQAQIPDWAQGLKSADRLAFESANDRAIQNLAKALEGGRLTDADFQRYKTMLFKASSSKDAYMRVLSDIERDVGAAQGSYEKALGESGYRVPAKKGAATKRPTAEDISKMTPEQRRARIQQLQAQKAAQ